MITNKSSLHVLMVTARYFPYIGGTETHVYEVCGRLAKIGVQVTVLTTDVSGQLPTHEVSGGVQIIRVPAWPANKDYYFAPAILQIIVKGKWDIIHCQGYHTLVAPLAMFAAGLAKIPYVVTFHTGGDSSRVRNFFRGAQRMALRPLLAGAEQLIGPSQWEVEFFRKRLHLPGSRFAVIPNGAYHLSKTTGAIQEQTNEPLIVSVGRLVKYKGHQRVIAALPEVLKHIPNARLRIVGTGPYEPVLQNMVKKLGLTEHVEIKAVPPGDNNSMASIIAKASLVTLLSGHEAQGIAVLEALSLQRPVLVANTTALQEFADRGLASTVTLQSSSKEVAAAMIRQIHNPLVPASIELPTWDDCTMELLKLYKNVKRVR